MSPSVFAGWLVATVAAVAVAVAAVLSQPGTSVVSADNTPAFAELRERPGDIARVIVTTAEGTATVIRAGEGRWTVAEKHAFPADSENVRELIVGLADLRLVEAKTERPDRYARLEVEDVDTEGAASRLVRLEDGDGALIAEVIVGKPSFRLTGGEQQGTYVRKPDEARAWLASGAVTLPAGVVDWLDTTIADVASGDVATVEIAAREGPDYVAAREAADAPFEIADVPEGRTVRTESLTRLGSVLAQTKLTDVVPGDTLDLGDTSRRTRVTTLDGVEIDAALAEAEDRTWLLLEARFVGDDDDETAEAARARVEELNARTAGWAFEVAEFVRNRLTAPLEEFLESPDETS